MAIRATNRPFDLDDAALRLPRRLLVDLPGEKERRGILKILSRGENIGEDVGLDGIVKRTGNLSRSDPKRAFSSFLKTTSDLHLTPDRVMCCCGPGYSRVGGDVTFENYRSISQ